MRGDMVEPMEVIVIDSDDDDQPVGNGLSDPKLVKIKTEPPDEEAGVTEPPTAEEESDLDALLKQYLDNYSKIEASLKSDVTETSESSSECMNKSCKSGKPLVKAPLNIKRVFCSKGSGLKYVCEECLEYGFSLIQEMNGKIGTESCLSDVDLPELNDSYVVLDSDEETEPVKEENELPKNTKKMIVRALSIFLKTTDIKKEMEKNRRSIEFLMKEYEDSDVEFKKDARNFQIFMTRTMDQLFHVMCPPPIVTEILDISNDKCSDTYIVPMDPDERKRTRLMKKQIASKLMRTSAFTITHHQHPGQLKQSSGTDSRNRPLIGSNPMIVVEMFPCDLSTPNCVKKLNWPPPQTGSNVYAMKFSVYSEWVPANITDVKVAVITPTTKVSTFRLAVYGRETFQKNTSLCSLAFWDAPPTDTFLTVGVRVIARGGLRKKNPRKFFSGMIAEIPCPANKFRYLVFFEDDFTEYVTREDVRQICDCKEDVASHFDQRSRAFIRNYLYKFPKRRMMKFENTTKMVKTENKGAWQMARVVDQDGALVKVFFPNSGTYEWIYRGSTRLHPVFEESLRCMEGAFGNRALNIAASSTQPQRPVARKSTVMPLELNKGLSIIPITTPPVNDGVVKTVKIDQSLVKYEGHECGAQCVASTRYTEDKGRRMSLLHVPLYFGFHRTAINFRLKNGNEEQKVVYLCPCGRACRNIKDIHKFLLATGSELSIDMFEFNSSVKVLAEYVAFGKYIKFQDISQGRENLPIACVNSVDAFLPNPLDYKTERKGCNGVFLNLEEDFLTCCDCLDDCSDKIKCSCWQRTFEGYKALGKDTDYDLKKIGYHYRRLYENVKTGIYECNKRCKCSSNCFNRVAQKPLHQKLQLFKTRRKGWGTRCLNDIPSGSFVCIYTGNILTEAHANEDGRRFGDEYFAELDYIEVVQALKEGYEEQALNSDQDNTESESGEEEECRFGETVNSDDDYEIHDILEPRTQGTRMTLRERRKKKVKDEISPPSKKGPASKRSKQDPEKPEKVDKVKERKLLRECYGPGEAVYIMDAKISGNIGRYLNHSCDPNMFVQNVFVDTHDLRFPWVAFFALRDISAGSELTWDYNYEVGSVPGKKLYCYCESPDCRGRLL